MVWCGGPECGVGVASGGLWTWSPVGEILLSCTRTKANKWTLGYHGLPNVLSSFISSYHEGLKDAIELSFRCLTIQNLGSTARDALEAIAAYPHGIKECRFQSALPNITSEAVNVLCRFFLIYREDGFVKMHSPFRFYILESTLTLTQHVEVIHWDASCHPANARMSLRNLLCSHGVTLFEAFPVFTNGPILCPTVSHATSPRHKTSKREKWLKRFESV